MKTSNFTVVLACLTLLFSTSVFAQNKTDDQGRKQGRWIKTAKNGKKISEGNFKDNNPVDTFYYYDSKGRVTIKNFFSNNGKNTHTWLFHPNGTLQAEGDYVEKSKNGLWLYYNDKGKRITEVEYKDNLKQGREKLYDDNGKELIQVVTYDKGKRNGEFFKSLQSYGYYTCTYKDDVLQGEYKECFPNKAIRTKGKYVNGKKEGTWTVYHSDGSPAQEFGYENDVLKTDRLIVNTSKGEIKVDQTEISMVIPAKDKLSYYNMQGVKTVCNNNFEQTLNYLNGDRFMRINEKSNIYLNVLVLQGIDSDNSVKTSVDFGFKIMPDENGRKIVESLTGKEMEE